MRLMWVLKCDGIFENEDPCQATLNDRAEHSFPEGGDGDLEQSHLIKSSMINGWTYNQNEHKDYCPECSRRKS